MVQELDLFVINPQDVINPLAPLKYPDKHFQEEWTRHNDQLSLEKFEEFKFKYMPLQKANYMWWYLSHKSELENNLKEDICVASVLVLESIMDGNLYTACVWPEHIPIILPKVDYVIVKKVYDSFFKKGEESGIISYNNILESIGDSFEIFEHDVPDLLVLRQREAEKLKKKFNALKIEGPATEFGALVSKDLFVNVRP